MNTMNVYTRTSVFSEFKNNILQLKRNERTIIGRNLIFYYYDFLHSKVTNFSISFSTVSAKLSLCIIVGFLHETCDYLYKKQKSSIKCSMKIWLMQQLKNYCIKIKGHMTDMCWQSNESISISIYNCIRL